MYDKDRTRWFRLNWPGWGQNSGRLMWTFQWTFGFHKVLQNYWAATQLVGSQHGIIFTEVVNRVCMHIMAYRPPLRSSGQSSWLHNGDVLCFLWGTKWIYVCYVEESRPPLWSSGQSSCLHNGDVLCFLWGTNWIYICYVEESRPPLWSSGQSSWLQIQRSGFDSRRYQIFWEVVGLERGTLSHVSTTE
jgi:hypothetical protein